MVDIACTCSNLIHTSHMMSKGSQFKLLSSNIKIRHEDAYVVKTPKHDIQDWKSFPAQKNCCKKSKDENFKTICKNKASIESEFGDGDNSSSNDDIYIDDLSLQNLGKYEDRLMKLSSNTAVNGNIDTSIRKRASFSFIEVRYYPLIMGDNPCVSGGPPVSTSSDYFDSAKVRLHHFEEYRKPRRTRQQLIKTPFSRIKLLKSIGYTESEIDQRVKEMTVIQKQRASSVKDGAIRNTLKRMFKGKGKNI